MSIYSYLKKNKKVFDVIDNNEYHLISDPEDKITLEVRHDLEKEYNYYFAKYDNNILIDLYGVNSLNINQNIHSLLNESEEMKWGDILIHLHKKYEKTKPKSSSDYVKILCKVFNVPFIENEIFSIKGTLINPIISKSKFPLGIIPYSFIFNEFVKDKKIINGYINVKFYENKKKVNIEIIQHFNFTDIILNFNNICTLKISVKKNSVMLKKLIKEITK